MTDLFLIAHKVRGEAAFDIAERMDCPECAGNGHKANWQDNGLKVAPNLGGTILTDFHETCDECSGEGYWWIVSSFGHRAHPYWSLPLKITKIEGALQLVMDHNPKMLTWTIFNCANDWPDLFAINNQDFRPLAESRAKGQSLLAQLGLTKPKEPIKRRI